jgi:hypothetical protein
MRSSRSVQTGRSEEGKIEVTLIEMASSHREGLNPGFSRSLVKSGSLLIGARPQPHAIQFLETGVSSRFQFDPGFLGGDTGVRVRIRDLPYVRTSPARNESARV